jgi:hypothetical protein
MELASMLAGEQFNDHPTSVCPVIAALLRAHNDSLDDERRQDLYAYAAKAVGSRASTEVRRARAHELKVWMSERQRPRRIWFSPWPLRPIPGTLDALALNAIDSLPKGTDEAHAAMLALIDELLCTGGPAVRRRPRRRVPQGAAARSSLR